MAPTDSAALARQSDERTQALVPWLSQVLALAPARGYNDHRPRTEQEMAFRLFP
ncbi:hypothetical protein [Micrococcus luteus]|uniref:hypothetical protein n=1 Tax=Micrococcus luteus TaxID=1270 RepID=UPI002304AB7E|nr:hypothetical protein [Micrococcus luteus]